MNKDTFEKEMALCQELSKKNHGRCNWGECEKCGVIPMLYKIGKGEIYETEDEVRKIKNINLFHV